MAAAKRSLAGSDLASTEIGARPPGRFFTRSLWRRGDAVFMRNANVPSHITGTFSVVELSGDYTGLRFGFARRLGDCMAAISSNSWLDIERTLRALWDADRAKMSWEEARPAIYLSWRATRRVLGDKNPVPAA